MVLPRLSTAICSRLPVRLVGRHPQTVGTESRETIYGASIRAAVERAAGESVDREVRIHSLSR